MIVITMIMIMTKVCDDNHDSNDYVYDGNSE